MQVKCVANVTFGINIHKVKSYMLSISILQAERLRERVCLKEHDITHVRPHEGCENH